MQQCRLSLEGGHEGSSGSCHRPDGRERSPAVCSRESLGELLDVSVRTMAWGPVKALRWQSNGRSSVPEPGFMQWRAWRTVSVDTATRSIVVICANQRMEQLAQVRQDDLVSATIKVLLMSSKCPPLSARPTTGRDHAPALVASELERLPSAAPRIVDLWPWSWRNAGAKPRWR
jgi:hypothetical protein